MNYLRALVIGCIGQILCSFIRPNIYVALSIKTKHAIPPITKGIVVFAESKPEIGGLRKKREEEICPSGSEWKMKSTAFNLYGNRVKVVQNILLHGANVSQYFYETFCLRSIHNSGCRGIDYQVWNSSCYESHAWTYGKIYSDKGNIEWGVIAAKSSCSCAIWNN